MRMSLEKENRFSFFKGEVRKMVMTATCDCGNDDNFIISTATVELVKKDEIIGLPITYDSQGKKISFIIDTSNLSGYYKLIIRYVINEETLIKKIEVSVHG